MSQPDLFVGIDLAKDKRVIHLHPDGALWRAANNKTGLAALGRKLVRIAGRACLRIGFKASGGYERKLAVLPDGPDLTAHLLGPARVRSFARAERQLAKTDPLDAAVIARCLAALQAELMPYVHELETIRLAQHVCLRDLVVAQAVQLGNYLESIADPAMRRLIVAQVARLKAPARRIEKAISAIIAASLDLTARDALLRTAPSVGPVVAACFMARMPELGHLSSRQFAALGGLAPSDRQISKTSWPRRCLYLAALTIARSGKGQLAATTTPLRDAGKPFKFAIVATMRKLLITLNAMVNNNTTYHNN